MARQKERFISLTGLISVLGVAVGVAALIVVIGVMSGFDEELQNKIIGMNAHLIVATDTPIPDEVLNRLPHVEAASEFVNGQAIIQAGKEAMGVLLKGIDPQKETRVTSIGEYLKTGLLPFGANEVMVGSELAKRLHLKIGDAASFLSLSSKKPIDVRVCGIFSSGMYEYDLSLALVNIRTAQDILGIGGSISGLSIKTDNPAGAVRIKDEIQRQLGYPYWVRTWMDMNKNLFSAIKLEKMVMFIILALIVLVACFNIASTLIMLVIEKTKDIGILKSIGATNAGIMRIFVLEGFLIGAVGAAIGGAGGLWLSRLIGRYPLIRVFGLEEVYYFERLPVRVGPIDFTAVVGMAVIISLLATIYPALKAARMSPVEALRYE